ncbi:Fructose-2,6-bisphosphatase [Tulasnella sp. 418]|nr:Fructose-2,6-bisphosphatase [Tulasnella sp. 418]
MADPPLAKESIDLSALNRALEEHTIEIPAGVAEDGTLQTVHVVPLPHTPAPNPAVIISQADDTPSQGQSVPPSRGVPPHPASAPLLPDPSGSPFYGARSSALKKFDQSLAQTRIASTATTPPMSVAGIGNKVAKPDYSEAKIVLALVGLPARGKSYLSNKLTRYLTWLEYSVKVFNVGQLRRKKARLRQEQEGVKEDHGAAFFSHSNEAAMKKRDGLAEECLEELITWLKKGGNVGIHDATNSTRSRRAKIAARVSREPNLVLVFLESLCDDPAVIAANVALKASSGDPDYKNMSREEAEADFIKRIKQYEAVYEPVESFEWEGWKDPKGEAGLEDPPEEREKRRLEDVDEAGLDSGPHAPKKALVTKEMAKRVSYLKIINVGKQVEVVRINGYLQSRIAYYLMNLHLKPRSIFFTRHGESQYNLEGKIGGDSPLSERGRQYARALPSLILDNIGDAPLTVWTSTLQRTIETASMLPYPKLAWKSLDELDAGVCDGMTYEEIEREYPEDFANRDEDKFNYRYRGGESYRDVVVRLEPVIMELERQENILIVGHQAIVRCLYAYFHNLPQADLPYINIPLHTVIKLTPKAYGCDEERYKVPIEAVSTHRPKPPTEPNGGDGPKIIEPKIKPSARDYYGDK